MYTQHIRVEAPRQIGEDTEFFLQTTPSGGTACTAHIHSAVELLYINEGGFSVVLEDQTYDVEAGDLILFCSNSIHHVFAKNLPKCSYYVIKIPPSALPEISGAASSAEYVLRFALHHSESKFIWKEQELKQSNMWFLLQSLVQEYKLPSYASDFAIKLKIMELMLAILREDRTTYSHGQRGMTEAIYQSVLYIRQYFAEDINEKKLACKVCMSYSYFSRSFKKVTGLTFRQYLNKIRVHRAEQLLLTTNLSVSEVATRCGFNNISYFISVYRSIKGETPLKTHQALSQASLHHHDTEKD